MPTVQSAAFLAPASRKKKVGERPDFAARLRRIFGDKIVPGDVSVEERESDAS